MPAAFGSVRGRLKDWWTRLREGDPEEDALAASEVDALVEKISDWVTRRRLEVPAILFLDSHRPLRFIASQSLLVGTPFLGPLFGLKTVETLSKLMEKSENVDRLIARIEHDAGKGPG